LPISLRKIELGDDFIGMTDSLQKLENLKEIKFGDKINETVLSDRRGISNIPTSVEKLTFGKLFDISKITVFPNKFPNLKELNIYFNSVPYEDSIDVIKEHLIYFILTEHLEYPKNARNLEKIIVNYNVGVDIKSVTLNGHPNPYPDTTFENQTKEQIDKYDFYPDKVEYQYADDDNDEDDY